MYSVDFFKIACQLLYSLNKFGFYGVLESSW